MEYKKIIGVLLVLTIISIAVSSATAADIWIRTDGYIKPSSWTSPNGFAFNDDIWWLNFPANYQVSFFDDSGNEIKCVKGSMTAWTDDQRINVPDDAVTMDIYVFTDSFSKNCRQVTSFHNLTACDGAMVFDGVINRTNFHLKTCDFDSGYMKIYCKNS